MRLFPVEVVSTLPRETWQSVMDFTVSQVQKSKQETGKKGI